MNVYSCLQSTLYTKVEPSDVTPNCLQDANSSQGTEPARTGRTSLQIVECRTGDTEAPRLCGVGSQFNLNTDFLKESISMHLYIVNSLIIFILY